MAPFNENEMIWYITPPVLMVAFFVLKTRFHTLKISEWTAFFTVISIEAIGRLILGYSIWPYIAFGYVVVGFVILLINYRMNYYFTVGQFFRRYATILAMCSIGVWFGISAYRLLLLFVLK